MEYNFYKRSQEPYYIYYNIKSLIDVAQEKQCSSYIIYAILECRFLIERTEFISLTPFLKEEKDFETIKSKNGIEKINNKFKILRKKYQIFIEIFAEIFIEEYPYLALDFRMSESFREQFSQYLHIYHKEDAELEYNSRFMLYAQDLISRFLPFMEKYLSKGNICIVDFSTLKNGAELIFQDWKNSVIKSKEELREKLTGLK